MADLLALKIFFVLQLFVMINPFFANLFFITATAVMFMTVFVATVLLVHVIKLIHIFDDILESVKRTTEHVETASGNFLDSFEKQSEKVSGVLAAINGFLGGGKKGKVKKSATPKKQVKAKSKKSE